MKFEVLQRFYGYAEERLFEAGEEVDMTKKRADEVNKKLKDLGTFLVRIEEKEEEKEELEEEKEEVEE